MATRKNTARLARPAGPKLPVILSNFLDARCVLECGLRGLEDHPDQPPGAETVCIRHAFDLLASVYEDLDLAILRARL